MQEARERLKPKLTLEQLSEDVGISVSQLSRFENGKRVPRVPELERIAKRLGVTVDELRGEEPPAPAPPPPPAPDVIEDQRNALTNLFDELLESLGASRATREQLADPELRHAYASTFAALSIERLFPEAAPAGETDAQRQLRLASQIRVRPKLDQ